ncbi:DC1, C1-like, zinc finger, RING/FYVE/PHD-type containing protein [Tanacetum coccineum]|uniref:DC1, C1-like, zinc finger, RING/FYVE/PHD-type containing protein n=1 Tax=Tanacetum coccineum TaxID=301880 RepID=A0ABQ5EJ48_9ASTR
MGLARRWNAEETAGIFLSCSLSKPKDRNVVSWTSMLTGYLLRGLYDESVKLHLQMQVDGVKPNPFTFATILGALADSGVVVKVDNIKTSNLQLEEKIIKMEFKELQLEKIQHEHPLILEDLQRMHRGYEEYDDEIDDNDLITMQNFKCICDRCGLRIDWYHRYYYKCSSMSCNYSLHKFCAEICTSLQSPAHPEHILILKKGTFNWKCSSCLTDHDRDAYYPGFPGFPRFPVHDESYNPLPQSRGVSEEIRDENGCLIHFSHEHPLVLIRNKSNNDEASTSEVKLMSLHNPMKRIKLLCNGCVRPIMTMPFYKCSQGYDECSNFVLHESCARLHTEIKCYECQHTLVLQQSGPLFWCRICKLPCNGFAYNCDTCGYNIDVHCGSRPSEIKHEAHPCDMCLTRLQSNLRRACHACRNIIDGLSTYYECIWCGYYLDCLCALHLPKKIRNKYDKHPLTLRYSPIENHKGQYFCEVCEDELNPEKWFYHCSECSQSIHSACAPLILQSEQGVDALHEDCVYKFVNMKFGGVTNTEDHVHPLSFVAGTISDGECTKCGLELQSKFTLKCLQCKFAIHSYCESSVKESAKQELVKMFKNLEKIREPKIKPQPQRVVTFYPEEIIRPETQPSIRL